LAFFSTLRMALQNFEVPVGLIWNEHRTVLFCRTIRRARKIFSFETCPHSSDFSLFKLAQTKSRELLSLIQRGFCGT